MSAFIDSILLARKEAAADDASALRECASRLQQHNRDLKQHIAQLDAEAVKEATAGWGTNDRKLIVSLCSRTKSQLRRTAAKYRELYDEDLREAVADETSGHYGELVHLALAPKDVFFADIIDKACGGIGCSETTLIELFVISKSEAIAAGKARWEGRSDASLIDYLDDQLTSEYKHLQALLFKLLKGERDESGEVDEAKGAEQVAMLHKECDKGMFSDFKEQVAIEIIGLNCPEQNAFIADLYEKEHDKSLAKALERSPKKKLVTMLQGLLLSRPAFIAHRLHEAMKGWGTNEQVLVRLLSGIGGEEMAEVVQSYEAKYGTPLAAALSEELSGDFRRAALMWVRALCDPAQGLEGATEQEVEGLGEDAAALGAMLDGLLQENGCLRGAVAAIDAERLAEASVGLGTDDAKLIAAICSRNKQHLGMVSQIYYAEHQKSLPKLISSECSGWYAYLAKFIVLSEEESDLRLLDLAMDGLGTTEAALVEFLCARPPARVRAAKAKWEARHDTSLIDRFDAELSGHFQTLCLTMLKGQRFVEIDEERECNMAAAEAAADHLYNKGEGQWGTCEEAFIELLCACSTKQSRAIAEAYENKYDRSLSGAIKSEFSATFETHLRNALLALLQDPYDWYAYRLKKAFKGLGTADKVVCRILGCADKQGALQIAAAFEKKYAKPLRAMIKAECSGNYKRLAIAWVTMPDELEAPAAPIELPRDEAHGDDIELVEDEKELDEPEPQPEANEEPADRDDPDEPPPQGAAAPMAIAYPVFVVSPYYQPPPNPLYAYAYPVAVAYPAVV